MALRLIQRLGTRRETIFFKTDDNGSPIRCCFRVRKYDNTYMIQSNDVDVLSFIETYLKEVRSVDYLHCCIDSEDEAFRLAQDIAARLGYKPFVDLH